MTKLIPTPIVNKNGVATTVHKRADTAHTAHASALPAPTLSALTSSEPKLSAAERKRMTDDLVTKLNTNNNPWGFDSGEKSSEYRDQLNKYSDELIEALYTAAHEEGRNRGTFLLVEENKSEQYLFAYLSFHGDQYERIFDDGRGFSFNRPDAVDSLTTYQQLPYEHTDDYYRKAIALTGVVATIQLNVPRENHWEDHANARLIKYADNPFEDKGDVARIANDDLVALILEDPDRWEEIADIVVSRGTDNAELIRSILNSETSSIREGML